jgi:NADH-quinone oxidoreductase subunit M
MPAFATIFMIITLSSIGLPGTNGFVGEFLILLGTFKMNITYAVIATFGIVLAAAYMLWMFQRVVWGKVDNPANQNLKDMSKREWAVVVPLLLLVFWIGIYPKPFFKAMEPSIMNMMQEAQAKKITISQQYETTGTAAWVMNGNTQGSE